METSSPLSSSYLSHSQESQQGNTMEENMDEKGTRTMSVELAMQRELAYRRKIRELQLQPHGDSGDETMPEQVQFLSPNSSRPNPKSSPSFSGNKQPASVCKPECLPSLRPIQNSSSRPNISSSLRISDTNQLESSSKCLQSRELSVNFFCNICEVPCSSSFNYKQHIRGKKHKHKLQELKIRNRDGHGSCAMSNQKSWCNLCEIWCIDDNSMKQHLAGQKHKKMQEKLKHVTTVEGGLLDEQNWCDLCGIECTTKELLHSHYGGKKHQAELRKLEYAQKGREEEQNQPKRCKLCNIWCANNISLQMHLREKNHFLYEVEEKKRQWIDLIRDEGNR